MSISGNYKNVQLPYDFYWHLVDFYCEGLVSRLLPVCGQYDIVCTNKCTSTWYFYYSVYTAYHSVVVHNTASCTLYTLDVHKVC